MFYATLTTGFNKTKPEKKELVMPKTCEKPIDDPWDAFELEDDLVEPDPEPGDFWGELNDDPDNCG